LLELNNVRVYGADGNPHRATRAIPAASRDVLPEVGQRSAEPAGIRASLQSASALAAAEMPSHQYLLLRKRRPAGPDVPCHIR